MAILWGKEIKVDEQVSLLEDFSSYLEVSMLVTIEKFKSIIIIQKNGWLNDARDFLVKALPEVCDEVNGYLVKSKLMSPPNWRIFLKERLEIAKEAGQAIYSYHEKSFQICASQYQQQYQATYEQELAKQDGLGVGIISSSLAAHLVYAAQSASKERENEKKASEAADKIMSGSSPVDRAAQMTIAFYKEKFDPFVVEFLVGFYSDIEKLIYDGLEIEKETLDNAKTLSQNELTDIAEDNHRERIVASLSKYPFNGDALFWAIRYDDAGDELISFCSHNPLLIPKFLVSIEQSAIAYLKKQKEKADLYNRDPLTDEIVQLLQRLRAFLIDERMVGTQTYDSIIQEVYGERIDFICQEFDTLVRIIKSPAALAGYAKSHKVIRVEQADFEGLLKYSIIFGISKINEIFSVIPSTIEGLNTILTELNERIGKEYEKQQEVERLRRQREQELAEKKRLEEEQRKAEEQRQKELRTAKNKKIFMVVASAIAICTLVIVLLVTLIIPSIKYNSALSSMTNGNLEEAYVTFQELDGFKDSEQKISELIEIQPNLPFIIADVGDVVPLGVYEQDNNSSNGKETLKWKILKKESNRVLVVSNVCIDNISYYLNTNGINTWETSNVRTWLNETFVSAFNAKERNIILYSNIENETYVLNSSSGNNTKDYIFLLSLGEAQSYLGRDADRACSFSKAAEKDAYNMFWWLRTKGKGDYAAVYVNKNGEIITKGISYTYALGIRPAMWLDISTAQPEHTFDAVNALESKYSNATALYNSDKYEQAIAIFKELDKYKDSSKLATEASEKLALQYENQGNLEKAVTWYNEAGNTSKANALMYQYVQSHQSSTNLSTYDYLVHLMEINYKDAKSIYANLYKIRLTAYIQNYDLYYIIEGGPPKGEITIRLVNESRWYRSNDFSVSEDYTFTTASVDKGEILIRDIKLFYSNIHRITLYDATTGEELAQVIYESEM